MGCGGRSDQEKVCFSPTSFLIWLYDRVQKTRVEWGHRLLIAERVTVLFFIVAQVNADWKMIKEGTLLGRVHK